MKCEGGCGQRAMFGGVTCGRPECQVAAFRAAAGAVVSRPQSPRDGRCNNDPTYHDRLRSDPAFFDAETIKLGEQPMPGALPLKLGLCPGCGTTVSRRQLP